MKKFLSVLALYAFVLTLSLPVMAQTYKYSNLYSFKNNGTDPSHPTALIIDGNGNLYGTAGSGGTFNYGVVYKVSPKGALKLLYSFDATSSPYAAGPINLVRDRHGNLYGDTQAEIKSYVGDLFKLTLNKNGGYSFSSLYVAPDVPQAIVLDSAGDLYWLNCGYNGDVSCDQNTSLNKIVNGQNTTVYDFTSVGFYTYGNYIIDRAGDIYGTEYGDDFSNFGLIYKWSPVSGYSVVHTFDNTDGAGPTGLRQDASGNIYGATTVGGANNYGTVFKITSTGAFSTLYNFCSQTNCADGSYPSGPMTVDSSGNIFGVVTQGVFKLTPAGTETLIYNSGSVLIGPGLVADKSGNLYGTTDNGGTAGLGSVYKLTKE